MLLIQCKYHLQVRNPSPNVFGQHLNSIQTFLDVQENRCILLRLFPVCLPLPSWILAWIESLSLTNHSRNNSTSEQHYRCCQVLPIFQTSDGPTATLLSLGLSNRNSSDCKAQVPKKASKLALRTKQGRDERLWVAARLRQRLLAGTEAAWSWHWYKEVCVPRGEWLKM